MLKSKRAHWAKNSVKVIIRVYELRRAGSQPRMVPSVMAGPHPSQWEGGALSSSLPGMPLAGLQSSAHRLGDRVLSWLPTPGGTWWKTTLGEPAEGPPPRPQGSWVSNTVSGLSLQPLGSPSQERDPGADGQKKTDMTMAAGDRRQWDRDENNWFSL